ncbi:ribonuclease P protein subunit p21 isoform X2 [Calonectris borealis]|uniref:ribonuclease P protein subunit p21 isoform X2 n=1 Tax=Calonectris borealis TaxID=1323832 RepID=UPI003F4C7758
MTTRSRALSGASYGLPYLPEGRGGAAPPSPGRAQPMGNIGPAHSAGARPIGGAMAAPVRDREALQRLSFLFQPCPRPLLLQHPARGRPPPGPAHGPLGEAHRVPPLLLPAAARGRGLPAPAGPRPRGQPSIIPTQQQSGDMTSDWSLRKLPPTNQKAPAAEINLPLFHIWY